MIGRLNHVAIAVNDLESSALVYQTTLGATVSSPQPLPRRINQFSKTPRLPVNRGVFI